MSELSILPGFNRLNLNPEQGLIKQQVDDFKVTEKLAYEPMGEGEHAFLFVKKAGLSTLDLARKIGKLANIEAYKVSYAGLKDKHAVTRQWFSVHLPGKAAPDWSLLDSDTVKVESSTRHNKKLRRGQIRSNSFNIIVRQFSGNLNDLTEFVEMVTRYGVPNYFTEQRFGINGNNLRNALSLLEKDNGQSKRVKYTRQDKAKRGLYLSAARSLLFNQVLSSRVGLGNWNKAVEGDLYIKNGRHGMFSVDTINQELIERLENLQISPTGPMYGLDSMSITAKALQIENDAMQEYAEYQTLLVQKQVKADRRALRLVVNELTASEVGNNGIRFSFELAKGCYATAVLREFIQYPGQMM